MIYAVVQDAVVVNVIEWDGVTPYAPPEGCELHECEDAPGIGWAWVDGAAVDPNPPPPPPPPPPPAPEPVAPAAPTKEQLLAQLAALQAQIEAVKE